MINLLICGFPYSGKGTQGELIAERYDLMHINMGAMLREEAAKGTKLGLISKSYNDKGLFTPTDIVLGIIESVITENMNKVKGFLFDGFPRSIEQAELFDEICDKLDMRINGVINLEVPREELIKRGIKRTKGSTRTDDTAELIPKRLEIHAELTLPLLKKYKDKVWNIDGVGTVEDVYQRISNIIEHKINIENEIT
jgi:adenylate kinase